MKIHQVWICFKLFFSLRTFSPKHYDILPLPRSKKFLYKILAHSDCAIPVHPRTSKLYRTIQPTRHYNCPAHFFTIDTKKNESKNLELRYQLIYRQKIGYSTGGIAFVSGNAAVPLQRGQKSIPLCLISRHPLLKHQILHS